ncbi:MAG: GAF domain-containing protein [Chloroflexi bacterium]|nr:GAF domain-containing protein [Chloroflexota bacterium]
MRGIRLSVKLPLLFVLAVALVAIAVSVLAIFVSRDTLQAQALTANTNSVQAYASAISLYLDNARSVLESTADLPAITDFASAQSVDPALRGLPAGIDAPKRNVAALILEHSKVFEYVMLLRADGSVYLLEPYDLQVKSSRPDLAFTTWYQEVMSTGKTVVSDLRISTVTQRPTVVIATPVFGSDGQIIGVWASALKLNQLSQVGRGGLESGTPPRYGYVTDGRGLVIGHQTKSKYVQDQTDFSLVPPVRAALAGQHGEEQFVDPIDRDEKLGAYMPLPGTKWAVVYEVPTQVAFAPIVDLARGIGLVGVGVSVLIILASVAISRQITVPLGQLATAAKAIGAGDLTRRTEVRTGDELGTLADEFNRMADALSEKETRLRGYAQELEQRVQERTAELVRRNRELSALYTISRAAAQSLDLEQILNNAIEATLEALESEMGGILLLEPDGQTMTLRVHRGLSDEFVRAVQRIKLGEGTAGKAAAEKKPIILDISEYPTARLAPFFVREGIQTTASTPLLSAGEVVGTLSLATRRVHAFPPEELGLLSAVGQQLGSAVRNAQLYEAVQSELAERRRAEESVKKLNVDLERRAAELEAANKELEAFSYTVSHDLRAPLRAIDGFSRVLIGKYATQLPPEAQRYQQMVRDNTQQMGRLIDDLLTFSRLSRQPLKIQTVSPTDLVRQALQDLRPEQEGRFIETTIGDLPPCQADPALLKQVWADLVANALKYTRKRDVARIEIGSVISEQGQVTSDKGAPLATRHPSPVTYFVRDNGVGFDMRYAHKLFGVFQRLHRMEEYEGTGVGLAMAQRIIHRHGGRVWAEAEVDKGATFYFTL